MEAHHMILQGNTKVVHDHLKKTGNGLTMGEIAAATGIVKKSVKSAINRLDQYELLARIGKKGPCTIYQYAMSPKLTQPNASKGYERKAVTPFVKPVNLPHKNGTTTTDWVPPAWETARPDAEDHKQCGSMRACEVAPWSPPVSMCKGRGSIQFAPGRLQQ